MKLCILGDVHLGVRNDSLVFHDLYRKFYDEVFFPYLEQHNIDTVVQLGDLFDRRKYINFQTLKLSKQYFFDPLNKNGITLHTLLGNHDVFFKNTLDVNSTELVLGEYENVHIHRSPTTIHFGGCSFDIIPWICDQNSEDIKEYIKNSTSSYCFGHFELAGFEMDRGNICHEGQSADDLKRYELVFTGHFHHKSQKGNILYVGTPSEHTWADYNDPRGFHIFDTGTRELTFIENPFTIFRKFVYDDEDFFYNEVKSFDYDQYKDKFVKVVVANKTNDFVFETFIQNIIKAAPADLSIIEDFAEQASDEAMAEVDQADDTITILSKYVDGIEIDLNKEKLKSILREVYTEALTVEA